MSKKWDTKGDKVFNIVNIFILSLLLVFIMYPLWFVIIASVSDATDVTLGRVVFLPKNFTIIGYQKMLEYREIWIGYRNSVFYTTVGTVNSLFLTMSAGYVLTRKDLPGRGLITLFLLIPMYFGGGLVPSYLNMRDLGLLNTWFTLLITGALSIMFIIMARTLIQTNIPHEMFEATRVDGCNDFQYFFKFVIPLSKAAIACFAVFYAVSYWNEFFSAIIFVSDRNKHPIQVFLRRILLQNSILNDMVEMWENDVDLGKELFMLAEAMKYAIIIVASLPMLVVYPFAQKYFTKGIMMGSLKG